MSVFFNRSKGQVVVPPAESEPAVDSLTKDKEEHKESADPLDGLKIAANRDELLQSFSEKLREQLAQYKKENS